ncbi:Uncharacterised protein [Pasteurella testudinis]|nr:Uncharacterised protein [Pasteurella testudinis]
MKAGVPFDQRGEFSDSPLSIALAQEHPAFLHAMLKGGLDPNFKIKGGDDAWIKICGKVGAQAGPAFGGGIKLIQDVNKKTQNLDLMEKLLVEQRLMGR